MAAKLIKGVELETIIALASNVQDFPHPFHNPPRHTASVSAARQAGDGTQPCSCLPNGEPIPLFSQRLKMSTT